MSYYQKVVLLNTISSKNRNFPVCKLLEGRDYVSWNFIPTTAFGRKFELKNTRRMNKLIHRWAYECVNVWLWEYTNMYWMNTRRCTQWMNTQVDDTYLHLLMRPWTGCLFPVSCGASKAIRQGFGRHIWHARTLLYSEWIQRPLMRPSWVP